MKIHRLIAENFMKLNVDVEVDGHNMKITGKNETGKSTFINLVWYGLTGKDIPAEPIQQGKDSAKIQVEVQRPDGVVLICIRKFKRDGKDTLTVRTAEGASFGQPQTFLNSLIGEISFDPFEFVTLQPAVAKKRLQQILKIDTTELENSKKIKLAEKANFEKQISELTDQIEKIPEFDKPIVERFLTEVADKQKEITDKKKEASDIDLKITGIIQEQNAIIAQSAARTKSTEFNDREIKRLEECILKFKKENEETQAEEKESITKLALLSEEEAANKKLKDAVVIPKDEEIQKTVLEINENNEKFKQQTQRTEKQTKLELAVAGKAKKSQEVDQLEADRVKLISSVQMPIPGLDFSEDGLTFDGLPFVPGQFSTAKMEDIGIDISIALNPGLKLLRLRNWNLFDDERKALIEKKAAEHGFQTFKEEVTNNADIGFILENVE